MTIAAERPRSAAGESNEASEARRQQIADCWNGRQGAREARLVYVVTPRLHEIHDSGDRGENANGEDGSIRGAPAGAESSALNPFHLAGGHRDDGPSRATSLFDNKAVAGRPDDLAVDASAASEVQAYGTTRSRRLLDGSPPIAAGRRGQVQAEQRDAVSSA
jgi:hypothetical protein